MMETKHDSQMTCLKSAESNESDAVNMLLAKLDEGTQTIINLRSILTLKTAELNELLVQLELTNQAITTVENTTTQIEIMLSNLSGNHKESLLNAEASLDSAIKTATSIYPQQFKQQLHIRRPSSASTNSGSAGFVESNNSNEKRLSNARLLTSRIRYKPDTKNILRKLNDLVRDLGLDSGNFFASIGTTDNFEVLQRAYVDLDIAKTISLSAKINMKRRNLLMRSARRKNNLEEIHMLGDKIREGVELWTTYTRNTPLLINGEDIITILDREDDLLSKNLPILPRANINPIPSTSTKTSLSSENRKSTGSLNLKRHSRHISTGLIKEDLTTISPSLSPTLLSDDTLAVASTKKLNRQSAGARLIKANIGLPRVRTSSITQQKEQQASHQQKINTATTTKAPPTRQTHIPLPPPTITPTVVHDNGKKSLLKPPSQRGPGSTLRLRSVLAKRGQVPTASTSTPRLSNDEI